MDKPIDTIIEALEFTLYKMRRVKAGQDECSAEEVTSVRDILIQLLDVRATTDEIAQYYGKSRESVRAVLSRHYTPPKEQPVRRKAWRFGFVSQIVPQAWKERVKP